MVRVAIVRSKEPVTATKNALEMIRAGETISRSDKILIKPNYILAKPPSSGVTTDPKVIEGVIKFVQQYDVEMIIGEGSGFSDTFVAFEMAGVTGLASRYGIKLIDLNKDELLNITVPNPLALKRAQIAKTAVESFIVSVPKLKVHSMAGVTLSLKNMIGAIVPKGTVHDHLDEKIVDLAKVIKPSLSVIDGTIGCAGGELGGTPTEMNLVIAGKDPVAVDAVGAMIMGISPNKVRHIMLAQKEGLGTGDLEKIEVIGESIESVRKDFRSLKAI